MQKHGPIDPRIPSHISQPPMPYSHQQMPNQYAPPMPYSPQNNGYVQPGFHNGYKRGHETGFNSGYASGHGVGFNSGFEAGIKYGAATKRLPAPAPLPAIADIEDINNMDIIADNINAVAASPGQLSLSTLAGSLPPSIVAATPATDIPTTTDTTAACTRQPPSTSANIKSLSRVGLNKTEAEVCFLLLL